MGSRQPEELPFPLPGRPDCTRAISVIRNGNIHHHHHIYHNKIIITIVSLYMYIVISSFLDQIRRGKNWIRSKLDRKQICISKMICAWWWCYNEIFMFLFIILYNLVLGSLILSSLLLCGWRLNAKKMFNFSGELKTFR